MPDYVGFLGVRPVGDLAQTASLLGEALGITFREDQEGRFDEFPAFIAERDGVEYALLGSPPASEDLRDSPTSDFELQVSSLHRTTGAAEIDISAELVEKLSRNGALQSWELR
jgi:hypothetical protein